MTSIPEKNVIEFLQLADAQSLMLTCKDMHSAVLKFFWLEREIASSPQMGGLEQMIVDIHRTDAAIAQLSPPSQAKVDASPGALKRLLLAVTPKSAEKKKTEPQAAAPNEFRNQIHSKSTLVDSLESEVESVAFHIASQRLERREDTPAPKPQYSRFHEAIYQGDVELVETALPIYLALPTRLMSHERKIEWLSHGKEMCSLEFFGRYSCGDSRGAMYGQELGWYKAIRVYVREIAGSPNLTSDEKTQLVIRVKAPVERDIVRHAVDNSNPAVAAAVLVGIHESAAAPKLKNNLLASASSSWTDGGLDECITVVSEALGELVQSEWVVEMVERLQRMKETSQPST